ncbi:radical SAM protein [Ruegeria atlantica]|uniref:Molybdenum cofactor biosynthesis protein A n=1 Tax=Ruegeria atlantica TaxID=81569 RepID=A0A0P1ECM8_9RHOB|nr:radical SAM protein [Ruegeria atlantica]CUH47417.1 molybdenum cofactor biosynthesis protein A [Ruegeria atlantica]
MKDTAPTLSSVKTAGRKFTGTDRRAPLRGGLQGCGEYGAGQTAGRFYPIACVALEITQRCNLDCTLCYLSDRAEMTYDPPLSVLFARLATIHSHYGPGVSVQLTGGDPTLRKVEDLEALCREIHRLGMRSCLMTNGIRASRAFLTRLAAAGLDDVAFHVDMTQERKGFNSETELNVVRRAYIRHTRGLGLRVLFNTTVFGGNIAELSALARFMRDRPEVAFVSFQMQADTGRGVLRERPDAITQDSVMRAVEAGYETPLHFDTAAVGHAKCNRYASVVTAGGRAVSVLSAKRLTQKVIAALSRADQSTDGHIDTRDSVRRMARRNPFLALRAGLHLLRCVLRLGRGLLRGPVRRQSVFIHNFMAADALEDDRCASCVFMVATANGPLSMCVHNAQRDMHLAAPDRVDGPSGPSWWNAAVPHLSAGPDLPDLSDPGLAPLKRLKGQLRATRRNQKDVP